MKFCLIGEKLSHSYSAEIHSLMGLDYQLNQIEKSQLENFVKDNNFSGYNVTIPYKKEIITYLDEVDHLAKEIGSVNTVVKANGKNIGYNTDFFGLDYLFKNAKINCKNKKVLILGGNGGVGQTVQTYLKSQKAKDIVVVSRTGDVNYQNIYTQKDAQIIINATPIGMFPDNMGEIIDLSKFEKLVGVVDLIYNPFQTNILYQAKKLKIKCSNGLSMLVAQALLSNQLWTGKKIKLKQISEIAKKIYSNKNNIVLIGMPSSGKTTIGKLLAQQLKKEFVDTDQEIFNLTGQKPSSIILEKGEPYFREIESKIIDNLYKKNGLVIATGGGSVLKEENRIKLAQNGFAVFVKRKLNNLSTKDRPISQQNGIKGLYKNRKKIYKDFSDMCVNNNKNVQKCVKEILKLLWKF